MAERIETTPLIENIKLAFLNLVNLAQKDHPSAIFYINHVPEVERWADLILTDHPNADREVVLLGVWLHDVGNLIGDKNIDHAVRSQKFVLEVLTPMHLTKEKLYGVAHCVRAHRNRDVEPFTIEAKIVAAADSASHMTYEAYLPSAGTKR